MSTGGSPGQAQGQDSAKTRKKARESKSKANKKGEGVEFTDFFAKLQDGQPPILETMVVKSGVTLEAQGQKAIGPEHPDQKRTMSRKEYVQHAEREMSGEAVPSASAGMGSKAPGAFSSDRGPDVSGLLANSTADGGGAAAAADVGAGAADGGLPAINPGRPGQGALAASQRTGMGGGGGGMGGAGMRLPDNTGVQPADAQKQLGLQPSVNSSGRYRQKWEAIGNLPRPPRYHQPSLGGPFSSTGTAQPPIGATMGHGLIHSGSAKESFFYPSNMPVLPPALLKAASEGVLRRDASAGSAGGETPKQTPGRSARANRSIREHPDDSHGAIKGDKKNQIYRNVLNSMTERTVIT